MWLRRLFLLLATVLGLAGCGEAGSPPAIEGRMSADGRVAGNGAAGATAGGGATAREVERFREAANEICRATPIPVEPPVAVEPESRPPHGGGGPGAQGTNGRETSATAVAIQRWLETLRREPVPIPLRPHVARLLGDLDGLRRLHLAAEDAAVGGADRDRAQLASTEEDARREATAAGLEDCVLPVVPTG